jgi:hypothetical protein
MLRVPEPAINNGATAMPTKIEAHPNTEGFAKLVFEPHRKRF